MPATKQQARRARAQLEASPWAERVGRLGLCSRGLIYCVVAVIALQVAFGRSRQEIDRQGALRTIAAKPFGTAMLLALAAGFAAYALWRLTKAALGSGEGSGRASGATGLAKRAADVGRALVYVLLCWTTLRVATSHETGSGSNAKVRSWSARLMSHASGRWLVVVAGAALIVTGAVLTFRAVRQKFEKHLDMRAIPPRLRALLPAVGSVGYTARGVVAALVGVFLAHAGWTFDPNESVGIDGALKRLAHRALGPALLSAVALGHLAFGVFSFVEARWRKVLDP
ncbi:MAG: DUF1206 domain-containing protein [Mycobacteriales bacterium]